MESTSLILTKRVYYSYFSQMKKFEKLHKPDITLMLSSIFSIANAFAIEKSRK